MKVTFLDGTTRKATTREAEIKPHANLQYAYLRGADLQSADLQGADLRNADLRGAKLDGIKVDDVTIKLYFYTKDAKKETVLKKLLTQYKNGHVEYVKLRIRFLRGSGHDWPELAAIEKSMGKT